MSVAAERLYLDWNATAPVSSAAREAAIDALCLGGNASSVHAEGRAARAIVERARRRIAERFDVPHENVTFTSGGTEANMTALTPGVAKAGTVAQKLVVSAIEHPAVLSGGRFSPAATQTVRVDKNGTVDIPALARTLAENGPDLLVSVMAANNETGVVQPLTEIAAMVHEAGGILHSDAVQAFGRLSERELPADIITISGHKIGAPAGVGALIRREGVVVPPLITGGGQERGARAGTENVAAVAGFAAALDTPAADPSAWADTQQARDEFELALKAKFAKAQVFGEGARRLPNTSLFSVGTVPAELALIGLDLAGFALSSGSACSSGKVGASHVLHAMGIDETAARGALRISLGPQGASATLRRFLLALEEVIVPMEANSIF